ncbi:MAG: hypothetical protein AB2A00_30330 [Myxococcota bacterium]
MRVPVAWVFLVCAASCLPGRHDDVTLGAGRAELVVEPRHVEWGEQVVGTRHVMAVRLRNEGDAPLVIRNALSSGDDAFSVTSFPARLEPRSEGTLEILFTPSVVDRFAGAVNLQTSTDEVHATVELRGAGVDPPSCDDDNPCTLDAWHHQQQLCLHDPVAAPCDDGNACTTGDSCVDGECLGVPLTCDDGVDCTVDTCDAVRGCQAVPVDAACATDEPCVSARCDVTAGCVRTPSADGSPCGGVDECRSVSFCVSGSCRTLPVPDGMPCDDHNECTSDDACSDGACVGRGGAAAATVHLGCPGLCGNGQRDECMGFGLREICDGDDVPFTCEALGYAGGEVRCTAGCVLDPQGCRPCAEHPAIDACANTNLPSDDAWALSLATRGDTEIGAAWLALDAQGQYVTHFAVVDAELHVQAYSSCLGIPASQVALAGTESGWLMASVNGRLRVHRLSASGAMLGERVVTTTVQGYTGDVALAPGGEGRVLMVWQQQAYGFGVTLMAALLDEEGEEVWSTPLDDEGYWEPFTAVTAGNRLVVAAARSGSGITVFILSADGEVVAMGEPLGSFTTYPRLAWDGQVVHLTATAYTAEPATLYVTLDVDGQALGEPAVIGDHRYLNPAPVAVVDGVTHALLGGYTGTTWYASHLDLITPSQPARSPLTVDQQYGAAIRHDLVALGGSLVVGWLGDHLPDWYPDSRRLRFARINPARLDAPALPIAPAAAFACPSPDPPETTCGLHNCGNQVMDACTVCAYGDSGCDDYEQVQEACDGDAASPPGCESFGLGPGVTRCDSHCQWDVTSCTGCVEHPLVQDCGVLVAGSGAVRSIALARAPDGTVAVALPYGVDYWAMVTRFLRLDAQLGLLSEDCLPLPGAWQTRLAHDDNGWLLLNLSAPNSGPATLHLHAVSGEGNNITPLNLSLPAEYDLERSGVSPADNGPLVATVVGRSIIMTSVGGGASPVTWTFSDNMTLEDLVMVDGGAVVIGPMLEQTFARRLNADGSAGSWNITGVGTGARLIPHGDDVFAFGFSSAGYLQMRRLSVATAAPLDDAPIPLAGLPTDTQLLEGASTGDAVALLLRRWSTEEAWVRLVDVEDGTWIGEPIPLTLAGGWSWDARLLPEPGGVIVVWTSLRPGGNTPSDIRYARISTGGP